MERGEDVIDLDDLANAPIGYRDRDFSEEVQFIRDDLEHEELFGPESLVTRIRYYLERACEINSDPEAPAELRDPYIVEYLVALKACVDEWLSRLDAPVPESAFENVALPGLEELNA